MYIYECICFLFVVFLVAMTESEEPYPSLSDYHDYEPNLEFDDTELQSPSAEIGKLTFNNNFLFKKHIQCTSNVQYKVCI